MYFCADNYIPDKVEFSIVHKNFELFPHITGCYGRLCYLNGEDNSLNRYFSLMGNNDPIAYYLGKNDRIPWFETPKNVIRQEMIFDRYVPSFGDNGFYYRRSHLIQSDLDHYYPMDCAEDLRRKGMFYYINGGLTGVWHRTSDNLLTFLKKRYRYARDLYCDRQDRRWRMLDKREDYFRLALFCLYTITLIQPLCISIKGFSKIRDWAWFWHWPVCLGFLITYTLLALRNLIKHGRLFQCSPQLSSPLSTARMA